MSELITPPDIFQSDAVPDVADMEWRDELALVEEETRLPLPVSTHDEALDELSRIVRAYTRLSDEEDRLELFYQASKRHLANRRAALNWVKLQHASNLAANLLSSQGGKKRSLDTPYGRVGFRKQPERLKVVNDEAVIAAVEAKTLPPECVKTVTTTKTSVVVAELQKLYKAGEIPPGCLVEPEGEGFYIK